MARREVIEITCDRCNKTEIQATSEVTPEGEFELEAKMGEKEIRFSDLCRSCRRTVSDYFSHAATKSAKRLRREEKLKLVKSQSN